MGEAVQAVAEVGQGALIAHAVEPRPGAHAGYGPETDCLNCGERLHGLYCQSCGQEGHVHRTLSAFWHDLLHGVFHFEGKIWRTLPLLVARPGKLTRAYIDGQRARFVSPVALFLFVVFLTFAVFNAIGNPVSESAGADAVAVQTGPDEALANAREALADLDGRIAEARAENRSTAALEAERAELQTVVRSLEAMADGDVGAVLPEAETASGRRISETIEKTVEKFRKDPELALYKFQSNAYKFSWILIPISVPFLWLLFPFSRRFPLYDHTVFVTYSMSFMLLLFAAASIAVYVELGWFMALALGYAPYHMYRQLKGTYGLGRGGALWRTLLLVLFSGTAMLIFVATISAMVAGG